MEVKTKEEELANTNETIHGEGQLQLSWGKLILFFVAFIGFSGIIGAMIGVVFGMMDVASGSNLMDTVFASHYMLLLDAIALIFALLIFKSVRNLLKGSFSFKPFQQGKTYLYLLGGFIVLFVSQYLIMNVFQLEDGSDQVQTFGMDSLSMDWLNIIVFYLAFTVVTPIKEEIIYRGVIHGFLSEKIHFGVGLLVSSIIFGALHTGHVLSATIMGVVFVLLYRLTRSLIVPIVFHMLWNMYAITGLLFMISTGS
ncbi:CPBP family intramembrane glutamic endopeptidase [Oceanobacillus halophilus]|uniref:CPBP family intramembrane metalloprotease n=1 Tax=Oceanobacillus halophilus TaxID=930130 RepID=A0A495A4P6_9BACI|nr:type II CAAX endopeptidase family protein [Oceanobacillus halophilus]RKQ34681.1 CPBP family intramembrane metalloprotease [Oceanobacillus halophilus]